MASSSDESLPESLIWQCLRRVHLLLHKGRRKTPVCRLATWEKGFNSA